MSGYLSVSRSQDQKISTRAKVLRYLTQINSRLAVLRPQSAEKNYCAGTYMLFGGYPQLTGSMDAFNELSVAKMSLGSSSAP